MQAGTHGNGLDLSRPLVHGVVEGWARIALKSRPVAHFRLVLYVDGEKSSTIVRLPVCH